MNISINEQNQEHIRRKIESGQYKSPDDVIARALALLEEHDEELGRELAELRGKLEFGTEQLRNGQFTVYDNEGLNELKERIKREGRERRSVRSQRNG